MDAMKLHIKFYKFYVPFHHQTQKLHYRIKIRTTSNFNWSWGSKNQNKTKQKEVVWVGKGRWTCKELGEGVNTISTSKKLSKN